MVDFADKGNITNQRLGWQLQQVCGRVTLRSKYNNCHRVIRLWLPVTANSSHECYFKSKIKFLDGYPHFDDYGKFFIIIPTL